MADVCNIVQLHDDGAGHLQPAGDILRNDRFRTVLDALPAAVYTTDAAGRITFFNEAAAELWGCRPELGKSKWCGSWKLFWPDGRVLPHGECPMARALKEGRPIRGIEVVAERPDGSRVSFIPFPTPLHDTAGVLVGAVNMLVDATDRNRAEQYAQRHAAIVTDSDDAIISKDLSGIITSWNRAAERLYGYSVEEAVGKSILLLIPSDRHDEERVILERIARNERIDHYETVRQRKDGSLIEISLTVSPIRNAEGRIVGASKIARDITERKRAQEQQDLLLGELKHRIKNTMATVHAVATQTLPSASKQELQGFLARLQALAKAHDLLTLENWNRARLRAIADQALEAFQDGDRGRILIQGPDCVWLDANRSLLMVMTLHELATNAVKYGGLSDASGRVTLTWELLQLPTRVRVCWKEEGGPPVEPPQRKGFGSLLIERALAGEQGEARLEFAPEGIVCTFEMAL
jgi:PAS domain S-box-containing protein